MVVTIFTTFFMVIIVVTIFTTFFIVIIIIVIIIARIHKPVHLYHPDTISSRILFINIRIIYNNDIITDVFITLRFLIQNTSSINILLNLNLSVTLMFP